MKLTHELGDIFWNNLIFLKTYCATSEQLLHEINLPEDVNLRYPYLCDNNKRLARLGTSCGSKPSLI